MEAPEAPVEPLPAGVKLERIREALQAWRDGWVEPAFVEDFDDSDIDVVMEVLEDIETIVDAPDVEESRAPAEPAPRAVPASAPAVTPEGRDERAFEDRLWREHEETKIVREIDRRPPPEPLLLTLAILQYGEVYGSARWCRFLAGWLSARSLFDHEVGTDDQWRARVRAAAARDMIEVNGRVPDGEFQGDVRFKLTERGRIELAAYEEDHPKIVREP